MNWNPENISFCTAGEDKKETNQDGAVKNDSVNHFRDEPACSAGIETSINHFK